MGFLDKFFPNKPGSATKLLLTSSVVWLVLGVSIGLLMALQFIFPDITKGVAALSLSRIRPIHVNIGAIAWISMSIVGAMFYFLPKLLKTELYSERLGVLIGWLWNIFCLLIPITLANGLTEGREWAELIAPMDWAFLAVLVLVGINVFGTVANRKEKQLYVSVWYWMGSIVGMAITWIVGNRTFVPLDGINDAITNWFYAHDVLGLWITTGGVGIVYYLLPKFTTGPNGEPGNAIYSHKLSLIGFWGLFAFYTGIGAHHIIQAPVPEWLKAFAISMSVMMSIPVYAVTVNFFVSMRGRWQNLAWSLPLRFLTFGWISYAVTSFQGSFQSIRWVNWFVHFTGWVPAHAHLSLLAGFSSILFAVVYYIIPRIYKTEWYSKKLVLIHFWTLIIGFGLFFFSWTIAGLVQATSWNMGISVQQTVPFLKPYYFARALGGAMMVFGVYLFAYNLLQTVRLAKQQKKAEALSSKTAQVVAND